MSDNLFASPSGKTGNRAHFGTDDFFDNVCEPSLSPGTAFSTAELRVTSYAPNFIKRPLPPLLNAAMNGNITIPCTPESAPLAELQWFRNSEPIEFSPHSRAQFRNNGDLFISNLLRSDTASYSCHARNSYGEAISSSLVRVLQTPVILTPPQTHVVYVNRTVVMNCDARVEQNLDVAYSWRLNDLDLDVVKDSRFEYSRTVGAKTLTIRRPGYSEAGVYKCVAESVVGESIASNSLTVIGPPPPVSGLTVLERPSPRSVTLRWVEAAREEYIPVLAYRIEAWTEKGRHWKVLGMWVVFLEVFTYFPSPKR